MRRTFAAGWAVLLASASLAQSAPVTPAVGSKTRTDILAALRPVWLAKTKCKSVLFKCDKFRTMNGWAYVVFVPLQSDLKPYSWKGTPFEQQAADGHLDDQSCALLQKTSKGWKVLELAVGPTDAVASNWPGTHPVPKALLGLP